MSPAVPETVRNPLPGMHMTGFAAVVSVHMTMLSLPVMQVALTDDSLPLIVVFKNLNRFFKKAL